MTPDLTYPDRKDLSIRPSWSANPGSLNEGHRRVFEETKDIPGWQMEADSYKLYEMAYFAGDVILELGVYGGRSAVVELKGALSNPARTCRPQLFALDLDPTAIQRSHDSLKAFGVADDALLYLGAVDKFMTEFHVQPTMVFVDADHRYEGVKQDLDSLSRLLSPGVPVLCHDYSNPENDTGEYGVRRAATEWEESGHAEFRGTFGCAALFVTTARCGGLVPRMSDHDFAARREALLRGYGVLPAAPESAGEAYWQARAVALEQELDGLRASKAYRVVRSIARVARLARGVVPATVGRIGSRGK
jgi:predicted O-methyltransferase YrrM